DAILDKPFVATDRHPGSPTNGTTYVYYSLFCNSTLSGTCEDGLVTVPSFASVILESHSSGPGLPFTAPRLVSGAKLNTQFSSLVIDAAALPHVSFDDFPDRPTIRIWESTLSNGQWVVAAKPVVSFAYTGLNNPNWKSRDAGSAAPGCSSLGYTAYCAFTA